MASVQVKQCSHSLGVEPRFYASEGDSVLMRATEGKGYLQMTIVSISEDFVRGFGPDEEPMTASASDILGVMLP